MSNDDIANQVKGAAQLTILSNKISEFQEKNLKMFPLVFFNGVKRVQIDYDLHVDRSESAEKNAAKHLVTYKLGIDESEDNSKLDLRLQHLQNSVWNLFWPNIAVQVFFNDRLVYKSKENGKQ